MFQSEPEQASVLLMDLAGTQPAGTWHMRQRAQGNTTQYCTIQIRLTSTRCCWGGQGLWVWRRTRAGGGRAAGGGGGGGTGEGSSCLTVNRRPPSAAYHDSNGNGNYHAPRGTPASPGTGSFSTQAPLHWDVMASDTNLRPVYEVLPIVRVRGRKGGASCYCRHRPWRLVRDIIEGRGKARAGPSDPDDEASGTVYGSLRYTRCRLQRMAPLSIVPQPLMTDLLQPFPNTQTGSQP